MRHLTTFICLILALLLGSAGESFALPECPGSPTAEAMVIVGGVVSDDFVFWNSWNNCEGT
jgi:hypothetical protein